MNAPASLDVMLRHFALISYEVPAERVRPHLPLGMTIDFPGEYNARDTSLRALISTACFLNDDFHLRLLGAGLERPKMSFEQCTYRTYVRYRGRPGVYVFGTFLSTTKAYLAERAFARNVFPGLFYVKRDWDLGSGYRKYTCHIQSRHGETYFRLSATKTRSRAPSPAELVPFLTERFHSFTRSSLGGLADVQVRHKPLNPLHGKLDGKLLEARWALWEQLGILPRGEAARPVSVLVQPKIRFRIYLPMPARFARAA